MDRKLLRDFCNRPSEETFRPLYDRTSALVYTLCRRILQNDEDARDAFQNVYCRLLAMVQERRKVAKVAKLENLLYRLAVREADNLCHRRRRRAGKEAPVARVEASDSQPRPDQIAETLELRERVAALVSKLPERYRLPLELHYIYGQSYQDISRILDKPVGTVSVYISRALKKLDPQFQRAGLGKESTALGKFLAAGGLLTPPSALSADTVFSRALAALPASSTAGAVATPHVAAWMAAAGVGIMKTKALVMSMVIVLGGVGLITYELNRPAPAEMQEEQEGTLAYSPETGTPPQQQLEKATKAAGLLQKSEPTAIVGKSQNLESVPGAETKSARPGFRIHGVVTDQNGECLSGVSLRWIPLRQQDLRSFSHDRSVLGKEPGLDKVPQGKVREALARSQMAESGEKGNYELLIASPEGHSVVVASLEGYELVMRSVGNLITDTETVRTVKLSATWKEGGLALQGGMSDTHVTGSDTSGRATAASKAGTDQRVDFELGFACAVSGVVKDRESGDPAGGMRVVAAVIETGKPTVMSLAKKNAASAAVGPDGSYSISGLLPAEYRVMPRKGESDYVSIPAAKGEKVVLKVGTDVTDVDFLVSRGGVIHGRVTGIDDEPLEGVSCSVIPRDLMARALSGEMETLVIQEYEARSDGEGSFEFRGLPLGSTYFVSGERRGYSPSRSESVELTRENIEAEVRLILDVGRTISGRVVFEDGSRAPGEKVRIVPDMGKMLSGFDEVAGKDKSTLSDEHGNFTLKHLPRGEFDLIAGDYSPQKLFGGQTETTTVRIGESDVTGVELIVKSSGLGKGYLSGVVVDDRGSPLEGASVEISRPQDIPGTAVSVTTRADGEFSATGLTGEIFALKASKTGYTKATLGEVAAGPAEVRLTLDRNGWVSGRVVVPGGDLAGAGGKVVPKPLGQKSLAEKIEALTAMMSEISGKSAKHPKFDTSISDDGTFRLEVPAGEIEVHASVPGFAPGRSAPIIVEPGREYTGIEIRLTAGAIIHGRVIAENGSAVEGASVTVMSVENDPMADMMRKMMPQFFGDERNNVVTDERGEYGVSHLAPGTYTVMASHPDYAPSDLQEVSVRVDQTWKMPPLVLATGGILALRVIEAEKPKIGAMVQVVSAEGLKQGTTGQDGVYRHENLRPGDYQVNIVDTAGMSKGRMRFKSRIVTIERGINELEVVFGIGYRISGTIDGLPQTPQRLITLRRPGGPAPEDTNPTDTDASMDAQKHQVGMSFIGSDNKYVIEDIDPGEYILEVPKMPTDPTDLESYVQMDRTPHFRKTVTVKDEDLQLDIRIGK